MLFHACTQRNPKQTEAAKQLHSALVVGHIGHAIGILNTDKYINIGILNTDMYDGMEEIFDQNPWWKEKASIEQDYDIIKWKEKKFRWMPDIVDKINTKPFSLHIILGPRQTGKTTALKLFIREFLKERDPKSLFYFNCENVADYKELTEILERYLDFKEMNDVKSAAIILDEITLPKEWYRSVKSLIDKGKLKNDVVILTGSSSIAVKREVELFPGRRGHGKDFILYPLSFRGFIKVIDPELEKKLPVIKNIDDIEKAASNTAMYEKELSRHLEKYMEYGGFPLSVAYLENKEEAKKTYLSWIKNAILKADRSDTVAREIVKVFLETVQTPISWESVSKKIEVKSPKTVAAYADLLKSMFAINILYNIDISSRKIRFGRNKKIHFRDPLLLEIAEDWCLTKTKNKQPAIAESLVVEHLSRLFPEHIFFWKNDIEIDAIVHDKGKVYGFEVKWTEKSYARKPPEQIKKFTIITKKSYSKDRQKGIIKLPLAAFLSVFDI